jgi:ABC-type branched-subunit amino acid transport system substrate-binding protein
VSISQPFALWDDAVILAKYPHYFAAGALNPTRVASVLVAGLADQGYFSSGAKVGVVYTDTAAYQRAFAVLKGALSKHGVSLVAEAPIPPSYTVSDLSSASSSVQSAVLKFRRKFVDHVLFLDQGPQSGLFMIQAAGQNYAPRYGVASNDIQGTQSVPASALKDAIGVSWSPVNDIALNPPLNAGGKRCVAFQKAHNGDSTAYNLDVCDHFDVLVRAIQAAGGIAPGMVMASLGGIGTFAPATGFAFGYPNGQRDGVVEVAAIGYSASCSCWRYPSKPYAV